MLTEKDDHIEYLGSNPSSDFPISSLIFISIIGHSLIFYLLPSSIAPLIKSYILSTVHACVSVLAVSIFYLRSSINFTQVNRILGGGDRGTHYENMAYSICYSAGYFICDLFVMLCFKSVRSQAAIFHHIVVLIIGVSGVYTRVGHTSHFLMLAEELSTIPLNLKIIYHHRHNIHDFFASLFAITFMLSRLVYGTIICMYIFRAVPQFIQMAASYDDTTSIVLIIIQIILIFLTRLLNLYWAVLIIRKMTVKSRKQKPSVSVNKTE
ncbi:unnamed protein product [Adineta steineri]|uniref:TLC domain-containing protein n=2 Tax=Adineta steineri TaxID=433720 RepID=A0A815C692_9BILA|nr:unnamed protein product [Adineta steineri]